MKKQDSYECHGCKTRHTTENMVAYCAVCFSKINYKNLEMFRHMESDCAEVNRLTEQVRKIESDLVREHENFLSVHRDNMRMELLLGKKKVKK